MNISNLNQLIPSEFLTQLNVNNKFFYFRDGVVQEINENYIPSLKDYLFKYNKINGMVQIEPINLSDLPNPVYTAEEWVNKFYTNLEVIALVRLEQTILSQNKFLGPKMLAVKQWLESMLFASPSSNFPAAPFTYLETSNEAAQTISV